MRRQAVAFLRDQQNRVKKRFQILTLLLRLAYRKLSVAAAIISTKGITMTAKIGALGNGVLLWAMFCSPALAAYVGPNPQVAAVQSDTDHEVLRRYDELVLSAAYHPNELYRFYAQKAVVNGRWDDAVRNFRIAARHADKYSQHRLSLLHWHGVGVPEDRVEAYLWSDLAAERGYSQFLAIREKMWRELTPAQQQAVAERGRPLYAEYGDPTAQKRLSDALGQARSSVTGSRTGFKTRLEIASMGTRNAPIEHAGRVLMGGMGKINLERLYDADRVVPGQYWKEQDSAWKNGIAEIGEIEDIDAAETKQEPPNP
jgi:uncharacterized protein